MMKGITKRLNVSGEQHCIPTNDQTTRLSHNTPIIIHISDAPNPITIPPVREIILGRADASCPTKPDLDLTPYNAHLKGVSRIHAAIRRGDDVLMLIDLESVNGTHLNGRRLVPNQPNILHDGDEIHLGKLTMRICSYSQ